MPAHDRAPLRAVAALAGLLLLVVLAIGVVMVSLHPMRSTVTAIEPIQDGASHPALQSAPQLDLAQYRAQKQREVDGTGPIAGEPGYRRIPLSQAMDQIAAHGLHAQPAAAKDMP